MTISNTEFIIYKDMYQKYECKILEKQANRSCGLLFLSKKKT